MGGAVVTRDELVHTLELCASGLRASEDLDREKARIEAKVRCEMYRWIAAEVQSCMRRLSDPTSAAPAEVERRAIEARLWLWERVEASAVLSGVGDAVQNGVITKEEYELWSGDKLNG